MSRLLPLLLLVLSSSAFAADHRAEWEAYLRAQREVQIQNLDAYARAGEFPINRDKDGFAHQFLDVEGRPCAVANLIWQSGHADLVQDYAQKDNDVHVAEQKSGPLADWVATSGLTSEEIAIIQEPGFNQRFMPIPSTIAAKQDPRAVAETRRLQTHLLVVEGLLQVDTESSIARALDRLGSKLDTAPSNI